MVNVAAYLDRIESRPAFQKANRGLMPLIGPGSSRPPAMRETLRARARAIPLSSTIGSGVRVTEHDTGVREHVRWRVPRAKQIPVGQSRQLRAPRSRIRAVRIEFLTLRDRIEDAEIRRRVGAASRDPLPARAVAREVGVREAVPEPAFRPARQSMRRFFTRKRSDDHADAIVHVTRLPQLAHSGVPRSDNPSVRAASDADRPVRHATETRRIAHSGSRAEESGK